MAARNTCGDALPHVSYLNLKIEADKRAILGFNLFQRRISSIANFSYDKPRPRVQQRISKSFLSDQGLLFGLIKCGIVCRNRLSHQQDRDESEYRNKQAGDSGNPLGGGVIPKAIIWWLLAMGIAAGGILAANWAIPPNKDKNGYSDPDD